MSLAFFGEIRRVTGLLCSRLGMSLAFFVLDLSRRFRCTIHFRLSVLSHPSLTHTHAWCLLRARILTWLASFMSIGAPLQSRFSSFWERVLPVSSMWEIHMLFYSSLEKTLKLTLFFYREYVSPVCKPRCMCKLTTLQPPCLTLSSVKLCPGILLPTGYAAFPKYRSRFTRSGFACCVVGVEPCSGESLPKEHPSAVRRLRSKEVAACLFKGL